MHTRSSHTTYQGQAKFCIKHRKDASYKGKYILNLITKLAQLSKQAMID